MKLGMTLILAIMAIMMIHAVFAATSTPLINKGYFSGDYLTVGNETYIVIGAEPKGDYWNNYSSVIFKHNITRDIFKVNIGKCSSTEQYTYCFNSTYYDWENNITWKGSILEPSMLLKVYHYTPEITLDRPKSIKLEYGDGYVIESKFKNTGSTDAIVYYSEQLPAQFIVTNCNICAINDNKVTAQIRLNDGEEKIMTYAVQYFGYGSFGWAANYNYSYDDKMRSETNTMNSTVQIPYVVTESLTRQVSNALGDISVFTLSIKNMQNYSGIKVNLSINNQVVKNYDSLDKKNNTYYYSGILSSSESKNFSITLDSYLVGQFPIYVDAKIESHGKMFEYAQNHSFNVSLKPLTPSLVVDKMSADPNDTIHLVASLKNNDSQAQYLYVSANLVPLDKQWAFEKINPGKELILYNDTFTIPEDEDDLYIVLSGLYRTANLQDQTFRLEKIINVTGRGPKLIPNSTSVANNTSSITSISTTSTPTIKNTTKNPSVSKNSTSTNNANIDEPAKKDFITSVIESIDSFIKSIFGKK
jgi:hypothetical protein